MCPLKNWHRRPCTWSAGPAVPPAGVLGVELMLTGVVGLELLLNEVVKVGENGIVPGRIRLRLVCSLMPNFDTAWTA